MSPRGKAGAGAAAAALPGKAAMPGKAAAPGSSASAKDSAAAQVQAKLPAIPKDEASRMMNVLKRLSEKMGQPQALLDYQADKRKFYWEVISG